MKLVVGLTGKKGAGKDTFAQFLMDVYGFKRLAFADALYKEVREAFGIDNSVLSNRATKESDLPEMALAFCSNEDFVDVAIEYLRVAGESIDEVLNKKRSPRVIMQLWGTEYRRHTIADSYWRDIVSATIDAAPAGSRFVITDVRFIDEAKTIEEYDGEVIRLLRPGLVRTEEDLKTLHHASEVEMDAYVARYDIENRENEPEALATYANSMFGYLNADR